MPHGNGEGEADGALVIPNMPNAIEVGAGDRAKTKMNRNELFENNSKVTCDDLGERRIMLHTLPHASFTSPFEVQ